MSKLIKTIITSVIIGCLLSACSNKLTVRGQYPTPLVRPLPFNVAVVFDPAFQSYAYHEQNEKRDDWQISIGPAQTQLFATVLPAMFGQVQQLGSIEESRSLSNVDLVVYPVLSDFQYNVPSETKIQMFEVWMKYNVKVYEADGELIADWIMTAYGKTPSELIQSKETALNEAMNVALRDAGANLSLTFAKVPEIRAWMKRQQTSKL